MNVIISNTQHEMLSTLEIDIIKTMQGEFEVDELISTFKDFFFGRMILDITAIKNYHDVNVLQKLSINLDVEKIILVLSNQDPDSSGTSFLSKLVSMGMYNFTTNMEGIKYLLDHPNSYRDVAHIQQFTELSNTVSQKVTGGTKIIGVKNVTDHAGSTSFIYMLKKDLEQSHGLAVGAIELNRHDFQYFSNEKNMVSATPETIATEVLKLNTADIVLIDLNEDDDSTGICNDILYLIEPSSIKLSKLIKKDRRSFEKLAGKKIILNKSLLGSGDITNFEYESNSKVFSSIPPVNDREKTNVFQTLLAKLGMVGQKTEASEEEKGKIFGLFKF